MIKALITATAVVITALGTFALSSEPAASPALAAPNPATINVAGAER